MSPSIYTETNNFVTSGTTYIYELVQSDYVDIESNSGISAFTTTFPVAISTRYRTAIQTSSTRNFASITTSTTPLGPQNTLAATNTASSSARGTGLGTGATVGMGVGIAAGILLIIGLAVTTCVFYRRDQTRGKTQTEEQKDQDGANAEGPTEKGFATDRTVPELDSLLASRPTVELDALHSSLPAEMEGIPRLEIGESGTEQDLSKVELDVHELG